MFANTTLCYLEQDDAYLMLHRTKKKGDMNKDKWIGIGGHMEEGESPEDCILREAMEETGYRLFGLSFRGIITFVYGNITEYMYLFTASGFEGDEIVCPEGDLVWIPKEDVWELNLWAGDKIFFHLLEQKAPFFSLKLVYNPEDVLMEAVLNGSRMELFKVLTDKGEDTGLVQERGVCHREGDPHETVHIWIVRRNAAGDGLDVLVQKRSESKDSGPGCYDISVAGHIGAGDAPLSAALREVKEELGLSLSAQDLHYVGRHHGSFDAILYGEPFHDREFSYVYASDIPVKIRDLTLEESEVASVCWMDFEELTLAVQEKSIPNCIYPDELELLKRRLPELFGKEP